MCPSNDSLPSDTPHAFWYVANLAVVARDIDGRSAVVKVVVALVLWSRLGAASGKNRRLRWS